MKRILRVMGGVLLLWFTTTMGYAQRPFDCNGSVYRVIERDGGSALEKITLASEYGRSAAIDFTELQFFKGVQLNGICYNPSDNLIYGLILGEAYSLFLVGADLELQILQVLDLPQAFFFVSGDISPDGRYLVLLGFSEKERHNLLVQVDLQSPGYPIAVRQLTVTGGERIYCADIAFHPTTGQLFGFDHLEGRLVTIDTDRGIIDNTRYPILDNLSGNMPSLFFDAAGRLYGIAVPRAGLRNRRFYEFDLQRGAARELANLGEEGNQDACSCPFTVNLYQRVSLRRTYPCTEMTFTIQLTNRSTFQQENLRLRDTLAPDLRIEEIVHNPFQGRVLSGVNTNVLALDALDLPIGTDSIVLRVRVPEGSREGQFASQAVLYNVQLEPDGLIRTSVSDDPDTAIPGDPTRYEVAPLEILFSDDFPVLCQGETMQLAPQVEGALAYHWNTGATTRAITVDAPGWYEVRVRTHCGEQAGAVYVEQDELRLATMSESREVERGSTVQLKAEVEHSYAPGSLYWEVLQGGGAPDCLTCDEVRVTVPEDAVYQVTATNTNGCRDSRQIRIRATGFTYYAPTAFSPDGNGHNDRFHVFGKFDAELVQFSVYDRWGAQIFHRAGGSVNDPECSWDGQSASAGVYLWVVQLRTGRGRIENLSGEVHLIR